jgi:uncharacterized protein (DUF427 family)
MKAIWNNTIIAQSGDTVVVEGNHYFPVESVNTELLKNSDTTTLCPWKGTANYFNIDLDGKINHDAAWYYQTPTDAAKEIKGRVAFWKGVQVID